MLRRNASYGRKGSAEGGIRQSVVSAARSAGVSRKNPDRAGCITANPGYIERKELFRIYRPFTRRM